MKNKLNLEQPINIPIKGNRPYLRAVDFYRSILETLDLHTSIKETTRFTARFKNITTKKCILKIWDSSLKVSAQNDVGRGRCQIGEMSLQFAIEETSEETTEKLPSSEAFVFDPVKVEGQSIAINHYGIFIEALVEKTRKLHELIDPPKTNEKWIAAALDVNRALMPAELEGLKITVVSVRDSITESDIENVNGHVGKIYFSKKVFGS